jgi:predicted Kef-type K+ transport protein
MLRVGLIQLGDAQVAHAYSDLIRVDRRVVAEPIWHNSRVAWTTQHALAELNALGKGFGDTDLAGRRVALGRTIGGSLMSSSETR